VAGRGWPFPASCAGFLRRKAGGTGLVVDVRPDDRIPARDAETFAVTAAACDVAGWEYRRAGDLDPVLAANMRWLSRYRHLLAAQLHSPDEAFRRWAVTGLENLGTKSARQASHRDRVIPPNTPVSWAFRCS
jgi:hypothetical protein